MRGRGERVEAGHGDPHEGALLVGAVRPRLEQREGGQRDGRVTAGGGAGLVNDVGAEGFAQARQLVGGDVSDPQAHAALDGVVELVGERVAGGGVRGESFGGDVGEGAGLLDDARRQVAGAVDAGDGDDGGGIPLVGACDLDVEDRAQRDEGCCLAHG